MVGFFSLPWYNLWHQYTMNYLYLVIVVRMILFFWLLEITQPWSFYGYIHFLWLAHGMQMLGHRQSIIESRCCWETTWQSTFKSALDVWVHANLPKFFFLPDLDVVSFTLWHRLPEDYLCWVWLYRPFTHAVFYFAFQSFTW